MKRFTMWNLGSARFAVPSTSAAGAILFSAILAAAPAAASPKLTQCTLRHIACSERCIMRSDSGGGKKAFEQADACIKRTCDKQHPGCTYGANSGGGKLVDTKPKGNSKASGVLAPRGTGVLSNQTRPSDRQPANARPRAPLAGSGAVIR